MGAPQSSAVPVKWVTSRRFKVSDWEDFCEAMRIDPHDPDQFDELLDSWSRNDKPVSGVAYRQVNLKSFLQSRADPSCGRCQGTGYIGRYKTVADGRCFLCFPDSLWSQLVAHQ